MQTISQPTVYNVGNIIEEREIIEKERENERGKETEDQGSVN